MKKGFFKKVAAPVLRGLLKSVPFGSVVVESVKNIKTEFDNTKTVEDKPLPHNWLSITVQVICLLGIVYAFVSKQITIEQFIDLLPK
jgi:tRNA(Arg) A34 adenosine deaminase TadA